MDMKRFFLYAIVIAALALAGCGGNGGGTTAMPDPDPDPDPPSEYLSISALNLPMGYDDVPVTTTALEIAAGASMDWGDVTFSCPAGGSACTIDVIDHDDHVDVKSTGGIATVARSQASMDRQMAAEMMEEEQRVAAMAKANAITGAIVAPSTKGDPSTARGIHYTGRPGNDGGDQVFVRAGDAVAGTTAAIFAGEKAAGEPTDEEIAAADELNEVAMMDDPGSTDPADMVPVENQFMPISGSQMSLSKGFSSEMHMRSSTDDGTGATTMDEINVFTNMKAPGSMSWAMYYSTADRSGVDGTANTTAPTSNDDPRLGQITIQNDNTSDNFNGKLMSSSVFPSGDSQDWTYRNDDEDTPGVNEETRGGRMMDGSYNGVSGRFTCSGDTCTVSTDMDGKIDDLVGDWIFVPTSLRSQIQGVRHDADYLAFGWWLRGVTDSDGDTTYTIGTFQDGADLMTFTNITTNLEGTAAYSGPAGGKYARKTLNPDGSTASLRAGHFTADATLKASFGGNDVAVSDQFSISGKVENFMDENDDALAGWTVDLMKAGFAESGVNAVTAPTDATAVDNTFYGTTTGRGDWAGQFYGPDVEDNPTTDGIDESETGYPTGVAGEFTAHFSNGHVIGAFGATRDRD